MKKPTAREIPAGESEMEKGLIIRNEVLSLTKNIYRVMNLLVVKLRNNKGKKPWERKW